MLNSELDYETRIPIQEKLNKTMKINSQAN
jgi:hypothetical protein